VKVAIGVREKSTNVFAAQRRVRPNSPKHSINSANCGASGPPVSGNVLLSVTGPLHIIRRSSYKVGAGSPRPREPRPQPQSPSPDTPEVGADISPIDYGVRWARSPHPIAADYLTGCTSVLGVEGVSSPSLLPARRSPRLKVRRSFWASRKSAVSKPSVN
jgi:hypothetical protein